MAEQKVIMTDPRQEDYFYQEAIKTLRTNIQFAGMDVKTILFTSCYPNEGKSDITFQLSQEIGKLGKKVLLLDADIRKSILASRYGVGKQVQGLSNYLSGQASMRIWISFFQVHLRRIRQNCLGRKRLERFWER